MIALEGKRVGKPSDVPQDSNLIPPRRGIENFLDPHHPAIAAANRPIVQQAFIKRFPGILGEKVFDSMIKEASFDFDFGMDPYIFLAFQILRERRMLKAKEQLKHKLEEQPIELFNAATDRSHKNEQAKSGASAEEPLANIA
jgi:hypothetical protein